MNVHPEMKETLNAEMEAGLKWWKKLTPTEIKNRLNKKLIAQQKALLTPVEDGKELCATKIWACECLRALTDHVPWCERKYEVVFERKNKQTDNDRNGNWVHYRSFMFGPGRYGI